jgi:hypothetical protein
LGKQSQLKPIKANKSQLNPIKANKMLKQIQNKPNLSRRSLWRRRNKPKQTQPVVSLPNLFPMILAYLSSRAKYMLPRKTINHRRELQGQIVLIFKLPFSGIIEVSVSLRASVSARRLCRAMRSGDRKCILEERNSRSWKSAFSSE